MRRIQQHHCQLLLLPTTATGSFVGVLSSLVRPLHTTPLDMAPKKAKSAKEPKAPKATKEPKAKRPRKMKQPELQQPIDTGVADDLQVLAPPAVKSDVVHTAATSSPITSFDSQTPNEDAPTTDTPIPTSTTIPIMPPPTFGGASVCERILDPSLLASQCPEIAPWLLPHDYILRCASTASKTPSSVPTTPTTSSPSPPTVVPPMVDPVMRILLSRGFLVPSNRKQQQHNKDACNGGDTTIISVPVEAPTCPFNVPLPLSSEQVDLHRDLLPLYSADNAFRDGEGALVLEAPVSTVGAALRDALLPPILAGRPVTILLFAMYQTPNAAAIRGLIEEVCVGGPLGGGSPETEVEGSSDITTTTNRLVLPIVVGGDVEPMPAVCGVGSPPLISFPGTRMYTVLTVLRELFDITKQSGTSSSPPTRVLLFSDAYTVVRTAVKHAVAMEGLFDDEDTSTGIPATPHPKAVVEHFPLLLYSGPTFGMPYTIQKSRKASLHDGDDTTKWANPAVMEGVVSRGITGYHMRHLAYYLRGLIHNTH